MGDGPDEVYDRIEYRYNRQGERKEKKDQNETIHIYEFEGLGRQIHDCVTQLGAGVDGSVRRTSTTYEVRGLVESVTTHDSPIVGAGNVVNEVFNEAVRRFEHWRRNCRGPGRIPNELWRLAAETAVVHGSDETARRLDLDSQRLRQWMRDIGHSEAAPPRTPFVELLPMPLGPVAECTFEWESPSGRKLRISLKGPATAQALELA